MEINTLTLKIHENATEIGINGTALTYRPEGKRLQQHLMSKINNYNLVKFINLDFQNVEVCDVSFIDEIIFELSFLLKQRGNSNIVVFTSNLDEYVYDNLHAAQLLKEAKLSKSSKEKKRIPLLYYNKNGFQIIGELEAVLEETFDLLKSRGEINARDIAQAKGIAINSASNRLKKIFDYGLTERITITDNSGVYYQYLLPRI